MDSIVSGDSFFSLFDIFFLYCISLSAYNLSAFFSFKAFIFLKFYINVILLMQSRICEH